MRKAKLSEGPPQTAHVRVSVAALWTHLEALEAVADDPAAVKAWGERIWQETGKCQVIP